MTRDKCHLCRGAILRASTRYPNVVTLNVEPIPPALVPGIVVDFVSLIRVSSSGDRVECVGRGEAASIARNSDDRLYRQHAATCAARVRPTLKRKAVA